VPPPIHRPPAANVNANLVTHVLNPAPGGPVDAALPLHPPCLRRLMTNPPSTIACTFSSPPGSRGIADMTTASREKPSSQSAHAYNPSAPSCYHPRPSQAFPSSPETRRFRPARSLQPSPLLTGLTICLVTTEHALPRAKQGPPVDLC
jgi:hypothetical protein